MTISNNNSIRRVEQTPRIILARFLGLVRRIVGGDRFENLYSVVRTTVSDLNIEDPFILDYGCGAMAFSARLKSEGLISRFIGMDVFPAPTTSLEGSDLWGNYRQISKDQVINFPEKFDLSLVIDVLHHAPEEDQAKILRALAQASQFVVVKDHFEYGFLSRHVLRLADWFGNYAYGVSIPKRYFTENRWASLIENAGLTEIHRTPAVKVHDGIFGVILSPQHHFISVLRRAE